MANNEMNRHRGNNVEVIVLKLSYYMYRYLTFEVVTVSFVKIESHIKTCTKNVFGSFVQLKRYYGIQY